MAPDVTATTERFTRLWVAAQPAVAVYLATLVPATHDAQDLLQRVALIALRKFAQYDESRPFLSWILGMARLEALHYRRTQARSPLIWDDDLAEHAASACEELREELEHRSRFLPECLGRLPARDQNLIQLRYHDGLKPAALASRLGLSPGAVRVALTRLRHALRACIEAKLSSPPE